MTQPNDDRQPGEDADAELDDGLRAAFGGSPSEAEGPPPSVLARWRSDGRVVPQVLLRDEGSEGGVPIRPASTAVGERAEGRYQVLGEIARGGVGVVLKGHDLDLGRDVAMKVLREEHVGRLESEDRFVEEAQIGGQLQHPGIVPVYEMGTRGDGRPYFTMKLVKGRTLASLLGDRKGPGDERTRFVRIFHAVCETLAYAHARGVIHRDLKPANVMVGAFGEVLVVDWGLSKVMPQGGTADERRAKKATPAATIVETVRSGGSTSESRVGSVMGTVRYMPPEQARGETERLDERADVFALGAVLCEILTGEPPYTGDDREVFEQVASARLDGAYERLDACDADPALQDLVRRCLSPARRARPRHAGELAETVGAWLSSLEERARKADIAAARAEADAETAHARARASRLAFGLGAAVLLLALGGVLAWRWIGEARAAKVRTTAEGVAAALARAEALAERADEAEDLVLWGDAHEALQDAEALLRAGEADAALRDRVAEATSRIAPTAKAAADVQAIRETIPQLRREGLDDEVLAARRRIVERMPDYARGHRELGDVLMARGDHEAAAASYQKALAMRPGIGVTGLCKVLDLLGRGQESLEVAEEEVERVPSSATAWNLLGGRRHHLGDRMGAIDAYREALRLDPTAAAARTNLSNNYLRAARHGDERVLRGDHLPPEAEWRNILARSCFTAERYLDAVRLFQLALEAEPEPVGQADARIGGARVHGIQAVIRALTQPDASGRIPSASERQGLRRQALTWLREELQAARAALRRDPSAEDALEVAQSLLIGGISARELGKPAGEEATLEAYWRDRGPVLADAIRIAARGWTSELTRQLTQAWIGVQVWRHLIEAGRLELARDVIERADELSKAVPGWQIDTQALLRDTEERLAIDARLPALLEGAPGDVPGEDLAHAARLLLTRKQYADALRLYRDAFARDSRLLDPARDVHAYNAACAAVGAGEHGAATTWLFGILETYERMVESANDQGRANLQRALSWWQEDPDLEPVRGADLDDLAEADQERWRRLWGVVDTLLEQTAPR